MKPSAPIIFIVGPTAVGKTEVSLQLAKQLKAEIVSCDSMQVYREVNIATSKPSAADQKRIPHHLLNVVSVEDRFDVAQFNQRARAAIADILKRKKAVLVVGGSGMYMQVLLDGIFEKKAEAGNLRTQLQERAQKEGLSSLYDELKRVDLQASQKIHGNDSRRIIRALEVYYATAVPISQLQKTATGLWGQIPIQLFCLNRRREALYRRINERVEEMFKQGLLAEVQSLQKKSLSLTAQRMIGVQELMTYLKGDMDLDQAKEAIKMNTRRLAKRQLTWFRKDQRLTWLNIDEQSTESIVKNILSKAS